MATMIKNFIMNVLVENVLAAMYHTYRFLNGHFGKKVLIQPYKRIWQSIAWMTFLYLICKFVILPIMEWWSNVVYFMNYVIWG